MRACVRVCLFIYTVRSRSCRAVHHSNDSSMAGHGGFQPYDPGRCEHYAKFASNLDRTRFEGLYWLMFALVIFFLFFSSWIYQWYVGMSGACP